MAETDLALRPISEVADLIKRGDLSVVELVQNTLRRIEKIEPKLNCYITTLSVEASSRAEEMDDLLRRGNYLGPLHGIPISLKDNIATSGMLTTAGSPLLADWVPITSATAVDRLVAAGAIVIAKANLYEFAYSGPNERFGPTHNPWDLEATCSGSSSGSAASVAAGLCYGSLGTDTGGSIRVPAALCGIVGIRPTYGRVSRAGVIPLSPTLDTVGPLARTVRDAAIILQAISGADPNDRTAVNSPRLSLPDQLVPVKGIRIGVPRPHSSFRLHPDVQVAFEQFLSTLECEGCSLTDVTLPDYDLAGTVWRTILAPEASEYHRTNLREHAEEFHPDTRTWLEVGMLVPATTYIHAQRLRQQIIDDVRFLFRTVDVIVTPAYPVPAYRIEAMRVSLGDHEELLSAINHSLPTKLFSLTGQPSIVMPCGFSRPGLPIGVQIAGRPFQEDLILRVAKAYEQLTDWHHRHPPSQPYL